MELDESRGVYTPSYFSIKVNTDSSLDTLERLDIKYLATYFHEYFHFLQDLTTPFGLNSAWNTYDRTIRLIQFVQQSESLVKLPLKNNPTLKELDDNRKLQLAIFLDKKPTSAVTNDLSGFNIVDVQLKTRQEAEKLIPGDVIRFVRLDLKNSKNETAVYWFGGMAIMETMTYLIQSKFFDTTHLPDFPYKAAVLLANHTSKKILGNNEFIFALCDISLFSPYPGWSFYEILHELELSDFVPKKAEDIYEFGQKILSRKWKIWENFQTYNTKLSEIISKLYGHEAFKQDKNWLLHIIKEGYKIRIENPSFMLDLYRQDKPFDKPIIDLFKTIGAPEVINKENKRWFAAPDVMKENEADIHTVFLYAFKQIHDLLLLGEKQCNMLRHCKGSQQKMPIDIRCFIAPWEKANQDPLCPFAALWKSFGLNEKEITFT